MKVEITANLKEKEIEYPCLMQGESGSVVLMQSPGVGVCLSNALEPGQKDFGYFSNHWDTDNFKTFNGSITLSNDEGEKNK